MQIHIDTDNLSELDITILDFILNEVSEDEADAPAPVETPKTSKTAKAAPAKAEPTPAAEPEAPAEPEEDLLGGGDAPTMSDAVAAATALVSSGGAAKVKAALAEVSAKRVSEMKDSDIPAFLAALAAAE